MLLRVANRRTQGLLALMLGLAALVLFDYRHLEWTPGDAGVSAPTSEDFDLTWQQRWGLIHAEEAIERAYREGAITYAETVAELATFSLENRPPRDAVIAGIRLNLPDGVRMDELLVGEPTRLGPKVYALDARIGLSTSRPAAALMALWNLGDPAQGFTWKNFSILADPDAQRINLSGALRAVVIEPIE